LQDPAQELPAAFNETFILHFLYRDILLNSENLVCKIKTAIVCFLQPNFCY